MTACVCIYIHACKYQEAAELLPDGQLHPDLDNDDEDEGAAPTVAEGAPHSYLSLDTDKIFSQYDANILQLY